MTPGLLIMLALEGSVRADPQAAYEQGLDALRSEKFEEAETQLLLALSEGGQDPALYHALGNALYRQEENGAALVAWERGLRLAPRDPDLQTNLTTVRAELGIEPHRAGSQSRLAWGRWLAPWESLLGASLTLSVGLGALLVRRIVRTRARRRWGWETPAAFLLALLFAASAWESDHLNSGHIIVGEKVTVRSTPGSQGVALFQLPPGTAITLVEQSQGQALIQEDDGRKGWVPSSAVLSCDPDEPLSLP
jgi:tetratricopeptide (TPR) repeat protein